MSNYNVGTVIRLTRQALNMSQEKLCENICSVQTLSRIENGRTSVKESVYEQLMERMGRNGSKNFSVLSVDDYDMLEIMNEADVALAKHDYIKLEKCVNILKSNTNSEFKENEIAKQYLGRKELAVNFYLKRISNEEYLDGLICFMRLTMPNFEILIDKEFPFFLEEVQLLMNISNRYIYMKKYKEALKIIEMLIRSLNLNYMCLEDTIKIKFLLMFNQAKSYGELGEHLKAILICEKAMKDANKYKNSFVSPSIYFELAWNMIQQIEKGERDAKELLKCRQLMRQGYALASLIKKNSIKNVIETYYKEYFKEDIYIFSSVSAGDP